MGGVEVGVLFPRGVRGVGVSWKRVFLQKGAGSWVLMERGVYIQGGRVDRGDESVSKGGASSVAGVQRSLLVVAEGYKEGEGMV